MSWARLAVVAIAIAPNAMAQAAPLLFGEIDAMEVALVCRSACEQSLNPSDCLLACASQEPEWEKDGDGYLTRQDLELALLEFWDGGDQAYICHESVRPAGQAQQVQVVVAELLCGSSSNCLDDHTAAECADRDGDGILAWQESAAGISDQTIDSSCLSHQDCGFMRSCEFNRTLGQLLCQDRGCGSDCTAFHLEAVAENNQELVLHVHYDYSPVLPTVLDLKIKYDTSVLTLLDARPLPALAGKKLSSNHLADGTLRLIVMDTVSLTGIPTGPIVELVFQRISDLQSRVVFDDDNFTQRHSLAPQQGDGHAELENDALWGDAIEVAAADPSGPRLLLSYTFDNPARPLAYADVPDQEELCDLIAECAQETDSSERGLIKERLGALQGGSVLGGDPIEGVAAGGLYLRGNHDHLRFPLTLNTPHMTTAQSFSLSTWFYAEGNSSEELTNSPQILFSHNNHNEQTHFGLMLVPDGEQTTSLVWFDGMYSAADTTLTSVAAGWPLRRWTHLGIAVDAAANNARVLVDGQAAAEIPLTNSVNAIACPRFGSGATPSLTLHSQGEGIAGSAVPQFLFLSSAENNLFGIERMDLQGLVREDRIRDGEFSYQDVDYSPLTDKLVFSSNIGGGYEIWIADRDGQEDSRRQVTLGFGDTARGIYARRPRWAPDGSAIVFESNAYDQQMHDNLDRGYHLYYVAFDAAEGEVAIPADLDSGNVFLQQLDYKHHSGQGTIGDHRLTAAGNNNDSHWLTGDTLVFTRSDEEFRNRKAYQLVIPADIRNATPEPISGLGFAEDDEVSILAAAHKTTANSAPMPPTRVERMLVERHWATYETQPAPQFSFSVTESDLLIVSIRHTPNGYQPLCWDLNRNGELDSDEDRNGDGAGTEADCYPHDVRNLYVGYDLTVVAPEIVLSEPGADVGSGGVHKDLEAYSMFIAGGGFVRVEIKSPRNNLPIPANAEIARVAFSRVVPGDAAFTLRQRVRNEALYVVDLASTEPPQLLVNNGALDRVEAAAFSPDIDELILAGTSNARPTLIRTRSLTNTVGAEQIGPAPMRVRGLSWSRGEAFYPCNWVGAYRNPLTGLYEAGFRGGLDDLKMYSYVREDVAFQSDAARGLERLTKENRVLADSRLPSCGTSDLDCPPYHLCINSRCTMVACDPTNPATCPRGLCALRPLAAEQENPGYDWVCSAECAFDRECFERECYYGPCRFCDDLTASCVECRDTVQDFGTFQISGIQGCPDRNSFTCEEGSCVTECYSFENEASTYLCDPVTEYCRFGRCVLHEWSWDDLAPASLSGLDEARHRGFSYTAAIEQLYAVEISAYGAGDYLNPPEILVEGRGRNNVYNNDWFTIGRVQVFNTTRVEAELAANVYRLMTHHEIEQLRVRLIVEPYDNLNSAATGLGRDKEVEFCLADLAEWAASRGISNPDPSVCFWRLASSLYSNGYPIGIPWHQIRSAGGESVRDAGLPYFSGGLPAVLVTELKVDGTSYLGGAVVHNKICSYEGSTEPIEPDTGRQRKLFFGDIAFEQSNERDRYCAVHDCSAAASGIVDLATQTKGTWALLNCSFIHPDAARSDQRAELLVNGIKIVRNGTGGNITETANACTVDTGGERTERCYEWMGDASIDMLSAETQLYHTIEFGTFTTFGNYDSP
jgi:hypothetical protein